MTKWKIMVVDDEPDIVKSISLRLLSNGYDVVTAKNGNEAVTVAMEQLPNLIILDIQMPDCDGHRAAKRLRDLKETRFIPIIFLTASKTDIDYEMAVFEGASMYISKPFVPEDLQAAVEYLLTSSHKRYM